MRITKIKSECYGDYELIVMCAWGDDENKPTYTYEIVDRGNSKMSLKCGNLMSEKAEDVLMTGKLALFAMLLKELEYVCISKGIKTEWKQGFVWYDCSVPGDEVVAECYLNGTLVAQAIKVHIAEGHYAVSGTLFGGFYAGAAGDLEKARLKWMAEVCSGLKGD